MIVCGIDPGLSGALAFLDHNGTLLAIDDIPTMLNPDAGPKTTIKREVDVCALYALVRARVPAQDTAICALEHVSTIGAQGSQAIVSLSATKASIMAVLRLLRHDVRRVAPQTWKRFYGLTSDKDECLGKARELYGAPDDIKLKKHHNRAEALLIARYALRTFL